MMKSVSVSRHRDRALILETKRDAKDGDWSEREVKGDHHDAKRTESTNLDALHHAKGLADVGDVA